MRTSYVLGVCAVVALQAAVVAQGGWTQVATTGPVARSGHAMAYDALRGKTVMFGGWNGSSFFGAIEWDGTSWVPPIQLMVTPPSRTEHAMAYDSQRGRTVLFGGHDGNYGRLGDTWEWDGSTWTQASTPGPVARKGHAMVYDSQRNRTVLFGGDGHGETWEWNGSMWAQVSTSGPAFREDHAMAYDAQRGQTVLFGGRSLFTVLGDTWEWSGTSWTQVATNGPSARMGHAMPYDSLRGRTVLFGGYSNLGDTWEWDGSAWSQVSVSGPAGCYGHAMAYDSQRGKTILFGGWDGTTLYGATWEGFDPNHPATASTFGNGCGNPSLMLSPVANAGPAINTTAQVSLANMPSSLAFVALGWSNTLLGPFALPFPLIGYGMPGCYILQSTEAAAQPVTVTGTGTATYSLPLPNWSGLIGLHMYLQGWAPAPGANPGNAIVSNGLEWVIGY